MELNIGKDRKRLIPSSFSFENQPVLTKYITEVTKQNKTIVK